MRDPLPVCKRNKAIQFYLRVIGGGVEYLNRTFYWEQTPQGYLYWSVRASGSVKLSFEDVSQISGWLENVFLIEEAEDEE